MTRDIGNRGIPADAGTTPPAAFRVTPTADGTEVRPSPVLVRRKSVRTLLTAAPAGLAVIGLAAVAVYVPAEWTAVPSEFRGGVLAAAALTAWLIAVMPALYHLRAARYPLVVGPDGELTYRGAELIPAGGAVRVLGVAADRDQASFPDTVFVVATTQTEGSTRYSVFGGSPREVTVPMPGPYFSAFARREHADELARTLARLFGVGVTTGG